MAQNNCTAPNHQSQSLTASSPAIEMERYGDICVLRCRGSLLAGLDEDYIRAKIDDLQQLHCTRVLADFQEVPSIGSAGIAFIVGVYTAIVNNSGGRFVLTGAPPLVRHVLEITRLTTIIPLASDFAAGLEALRA